MGAIAEFFQANQIILYFLYGQAFFILGLAVALQARKHSQLPLASRLWLLAGFGLIHAFYEWGAVFIPLQQKTPGNLVGFLQVLQLMLGVVSFLALFQFGTELSTLEPSKWRWITALPAAIFLTWSLGILLAEEQFVITLAQMVQTGEVLGRYGLGVPGSALAALGLWKQAKQVERMDLPHISYHFRGAAYAFVAYAALTAVVPAADFFPANVLNYGTVVKMIGIPVPVFRTLVGMTIAYLIIRGMDIFQVETDRMLEQAAQASAVAADRERIGRELHDSTIQSIYASGLMLEDALLTIDEDKGRAQARVQDVISSLNQTIGDIRRYILDLRSDSMTGDLEASMQEAVRSFRLETFIDAEIVVEGDRRNGLTGQQQEQVLTVLREALTNVSKHAQATHVNVRLVYSPDAIEVQIGDNGIGFGRNGDEHKPEPGTRQGLRNMQERARLIGAQLQIESAPGQGTRLRLCLPCSTQERK